MIDRIVNFFTSLRLTVVCLGLALILVFVGTLAQVQLGLYRVQSEFFRSLVIFWTPAGSHWKIPVFPGGWLIGLVLLMNLIAAHIKRFQLSWKKSGIILIHLGLILLLLGQFLTEMFQIESQMRLEPGQTKNYAEDSRRNELAVIDTTNPDSDQVVAIPESLVAKGGEIQPPGMPFKLHVKTYFPNSHFTGPMVPGDKVNSSEGIGKRLPFIAAPTVTRMDAENEPLALVEVDSDKGPVGDWVLSTWFTRYPAFAQCQEDVGDMMGITVETPQSFTLAGHTYQIALRPVRYYKPYSITLLKFTHEVYQGTDIPKNFASKIHLSDAKAGENRDVLIYMNSPLRYGGETFYQASFEPGDKGTILQVVRNPASITPYLACSLVALGLITQFLMHLFSFGKKRAQQLKTGPVPKKTPRNGIEPALAGSKKGNL